MTRGSAVAVGAAAAVLSLALAGCGSSHTSPPASFPSVTSVRGVVDKTLPHPVGVQVAVEQDGHVVLDHGYGEADVAAKRPVRTSTRFRIGSVTKQVTAALVLRQVAAGKVSLDAPLAKALPGVGWPHGTTLRQVLQQTSGLGGHAPSPAVIARGRPAVDAFIAAQTPMAAPGALWKYDNDNYLVAGDVVERDTGHSYLAAASAILPGGGGCRGVAASYDALGSKPQQVTPARYGLTFAAGGLCSTARDLLAWQDSLRSGALGADLYTTMTHVSRQSRAFGLPYGMGLFVGHDVVWHDGYLASLTDPAGGQTAYLAWLPREKAGVAVLANTAGDSPGDARAVGEALVSRLRH